MKANTIKTLLAAAASVVLLGSTGFSQAAGTWNLGLGVHNLSPKSSNSPALGGARATVDDDLQPTVTIEYFVYENLGIELIASLPFRHSVKANGDYIGQTKLLPPTLSVQYYFVNSSKFTPFVGVGLNYTTFFDTRGAGILSGVDLDAEDSWGFAAHAGVDYKLTERSSLRIDARWVDVETELKAGGAKVGKLQLDPVVFGAAWVFKF